MTTAKVDWLSFRTKSLPNQAGSALAECFGGRHRVMLGNERPGWQGYDRAGSVTLDGMRVGMYGAGGANQRGWATFQVDGQGCGWVEDWEAAVGVLEGLEDYEARRVDLAVDTFRREVSHAAVLEGYEAGEFTAHRNTPSMRKIEGSPRESGFTVYVGKRDQAKFFRGYEKGFEQLGKLGEGWADVRVAEHGTPVADWYRCEVELKAKDGPLPVDLIERRDEYFAGSYPFCRKLIDAEPFQLALTREARPKAELAAAAANVRFQYGSTLFTLLHAHGGDISAVWDLVCGDRHCQRLIEAGVFLVDHA